LNAAVAWNRGDNQIAALTLISIGLPPVFPWLIAGIMGLVAVFSVLIALRTPGRHDTPDRCWKAGVFYFNPDDRSLFVPKRFGIGYTVNFAHPWAAVVLVAVIAMISAPLILVLFVLHRALPVHR